MHVNTLLVRDTFERNEMADLARGVVGWDVRIGGLAIA